MDWLTAIVDAYSASKKQDSGSGDGGGGGMAWLDTSTKGDMYPGGNFGPSPSYAGGGVWNVATSGSKASNSGSASTAQGVASADTWQKYIPLGLGFLALVIAWKMLNTK